ncbi:calcium-activated potassium channel subunit alpha-1-like [Paramacrobiotus metropolitanus]|uniref:calcium-activated potassium channel subunit alpha-1-like n=1 Tax=Paramacrobiotus metropolitanus TaxID=2943436 RepID=UPI002445CC51|nr:calcium-activated potassium channel subunit alpha-1-like [Paramacrobiotus metropolitanus]
MASDGYSGGWRWAPYSGLPPASSARPEGGQSSSSDAEERQDADWEASPLARMIAWFYDNHNLTGATAATAPVLGSVSELYAASHNASEPVKLPAACYGVDNAIPLKGIYFVVGLVLPLFVLLFWLFKAIDRRVFGRRYRRLLYGGARSGYEVLEDADLDMQARVRADVLLEEKLIKQRTEALKQLSTTGRTEFDRSQLEEWVADATSPNSTHGFWLMVVAIGCAMVSLAVYLASVTKQLPSLEICGTMPNGQQCLDLLANAYLLAYLIIRVAGTHDKLDALMSPYSFVDYLVIPAVVGGICLNRYFTGFSFLRWYNLMWLLELVAQRGFFQKQSSLKLTYLVLLVVVILTTSAGVLHLFENAGDHSLWSEKAYNGQSVTYWKCFQYLYGRLTLIDLSGLKVTTIMGKLTVYLFQLAALTTIGRTIPQIVSLVKRTPDYDKDYKPPKHYLHVVVSGTVSNDAIKLFLQEFYHPDRDVGRRVRVVILGEQPPDADTERMVKQYYNRAEYRRGSVMEPRDLARIRAADAAAVLLLADVESPEPDSADAINVMRVVSVKDLRNEMRVLVQILHYKNKEYVQKIPAWNAEKGDAVLCCAEIRLGLLAQSCNAPGFSTLMANLFVSRIHKEDEQWEGTWQSDYGRGAALELSARVISESFVGMTFRQLAEFCYRRFDVLLVAIKLNQRLSAYPLINPGDDVRITPGCIGFFIADTVADLAPVMLYCAHCHRDTLDPKSIRQCQCDSKANVTTKEPAKEADSDDDSYYDEEAARRAHALSPETVNKLWEYIRLTPSASTHPPTKRGRKVTDTDLERSMELASPTALRFRRKSAKEAAAASTPLSAAASLDNLDNEHVPTDYLYDSTGCFFWSPGRRLYDIVIDRQEAAMRDWQDHIVLCILTKPDSQPIGLHTFVWPLRSSTVRPERLAEIVILCDPKFMEKEWMWLTNMPKLTVVKGDALNRVDLRAVSVKSARMVVIVGAPGIHESLLYKGLHHSLIDKEVIIATQNVRDMSFSEKELCFAIRDDEGGGRQVNIEEELSGNMDWKATSSLLERFPVGHLMGSHIPVITQLCVLNNTRYLDLYDRSPRLVLEPHLSHVYACGRAFSSFVVDALTICSFFNPSMYNIFNTLVFGKHCEEVEKIVTEGAGLLGGEGIGEKAAFVQDEVIIRHIPLGVASSPFYGYAEMNYGALLLEALSKWGFLCLGLYRRMTLYDALVAPSKRFVICNPPRDFILHPTDLIFCLIRVDQANRDAQGRAAVDGQGQGQGQGQGHDTGRGFDIDDTVLNRWD